MITFEQVTKRYGERLALDSVSWHMDEGECVTVLGHSGAGKTSILRLITHETAPTSGTVVVGTFRSPRLARGQRALLRRTLGSIYEDFRLLNDRTVFENVALAVRITGRFMDNEVIPRVLYALSEVGLQNRQIDKPNELSAGEKQRVAIARAIVNRPAVILADEPTGALESKSANEVIALLKRIHGEGAALLFVTTRREVAEAMGGRIMTLEEDGRLTGDTFPSRAPGAPGAPAMALAAAPPFDPAPPPLPVQASPPEPPVAIASDPAAPPA